MIDAEYVTTAAAFIRGKETVRVSELAKHMYNPAYLPGGAVDFNELKVVAFVDLVVQSGHYRHEDGILIKNNAADRLARI